MRGAPHRGFAAAIRLTKALISASMGGRPQVGRRESWVQYRHGPRSIVVDACLLRRLFAVVVTEPPPTWAAHREAM
jgi:hypothetical protein